MASSTFTIVDQFGIPVYGVDVRLSRGILGEDKAEDSRPVDEAGHVSFLEVKKILPTPATLPNGGDTGPGHTIHINFRKGYTCPGDKWLEYEHKSVFYTDIEDPAEIAKPITLVKKVAPPPPGNTCPVNYDKTQFTNWFFAMVTKYNEPTVTTAAMARMAEEVQKCGMLWQNQGIYPVNQWRPRLHQPPILPNHDSDHNVDCGDFGQPWKLTFRY